MFLRYNKEQNICNFKCTFNPFTANVAYTDIEGAQNLRLLLPKLLIVMF